MEFRIVGLGFGVQGSGCMEFRIVGLGRRVQDLGFGRVGVCGLRLGVRGSSCPYPTFQAPHALRFGAPASQVRSRVQSEGKG